MPPTMHPMPGGMLSNQKALSQPGRLHLTLSRGGIPAFEFTHSEGIRDKVAGLPPNFLCVNKYDQSELRNSQQDAMDIYNDNEAKTEGNDPEDDGVWDAWYRWLCRECNKDQQAWNSIFTYMSETRIELIVETMDNEPWMVFEGGEWKEKSVPAARSSTGIGPPPRPLTVSNSRPQRSSSLRNEIKPEDDQGK
ncbi:hypothetical protein GGTG_06314 [Gaeumannomyces tritici R3-111a-1]|uniref:Uncharacterized protein n=1 Tax=Gaeumannomyces tritici (strain R3-111a-1) TaxID=644352 RepID=J3NYG2_GAET3|nr:hypothetical protein GGTG_06314 [Gaeumannomyces tritici R3-111a-1]EJT76395.1 hypothetical protein GGTG_06314 [Gaeumannomyces tritici R3-111a-1]